MSGGRRSQRVGLIGYPLRHSISPVFQQAAFDSFALPVTYELWETPPDLVEELTGRLRRDDTLGANVTIPYKQAVIPFLDVIDPSAHTVGAVNTIVRREARLIGYNTDVTGFSQSLRIDGPLDLVGRNVLVIGAGGAARAVVVACCLGQAASVVVCSRRTEQAASLVSDLKDRTTGALPTATSWAAWSAIADPPHAPVHAVDLLVNATPVGTRHHASGDPMAVPAEALHDRLFVFDLVYNPSETPLLRECRHRGIPHLNGLPMLVYQGAAAFELWTERPAPVEVMRQAAREALGV